MSMSPTSSIVAAATTTVALVTSPHIPSATLPTTAVASASFGDKVLTAASQGAAGAIIGAMLSSVTEPFANRLLVKRMTISEAMADMNVKQCATFFQTTLPTNFIKFPLFEALNEMIRLLKVPAGISGVVIGAMFTTATLPITNYRFCKSMNEEVSLSSPKLWVAYLPTVVRDIIYAQFRNAADGFIHRNYPTLRSTTSGRVLAMFIVVMLSCIISSPCNEWRGYMLQPADKRKSVADFFQLERYLRSTLVGATVMGTSMGIATLVGPPFQQYVLPLVKDRRTLLLVVLLAAAYHASKGNFPSKCFNLSCFTSSSASTSTTTSIPTNNSSNPSPKV